MPKPHESESIAGGTHRREFRIRYPSDTHLVDPAPLDFCGRFGFRPQRIQEIKLIAGELVENILKHGQRGSLTVIFHHAEPAHLEILSQNRGDLPAMAREDGFSTDNTLGLGLGIVTRLSDQFQCEQEGALVRIRAVKYRDAFPVRSEVAVLSYPVMMRDECNGDAYLIHRNFSDLFCVIDALGHGEDAFRSASRLKIHLSNHLQEDVEGFIARAHAFLRAHQLRGAVMSVVRLDYQRREIAFGGLGDVTVKIFPPATDKVLHPLPSEGIAGDRARTVRRQVFPLVSGSLVAMFSDGLSSRLTVSQAERSEKPAVLVNLLMKKYGKIHDDRTLLLAKVL